MDCNRFSNDRKILLNKIHPILKNSGRKVNVKNILGFPDQIKEVKQDDYNIVREVVWYELSKFIWVTERFKKPLWITPFLKKGIG